MTHFEHLIILFAIMVGLALADLAFSLHRLLRGGSKVRWDWLALIAAADVALLILLKWWVIFAYQAFERQVTFSLFLSLFVEFVLLTLLALAVLPDEVPAEGLDLAVWFDGRRRQIFGLFAVYVAYTALASLAREVEFGGVTIGDLAWLLAREGGLMAACLTLVLVRRRWCHTVALASLFVLLVFVAVVSGIR